MLESGNYVVGFPHRPPANPATGQAMLESDNHVAGFPHRPPANPTTGQAMLESDNHVAGFPHRLDHGCRDANPAPLGWSDGR